MRPTHVDNFGIFFVTTNTWGRRHLFRAHPFANLFVNTLYTYRAQQKYLLHEFVIMPDHLHLIVTPIWTTSLSG